jgi:hypothetical protein
MSGAIPSAPTPLHPWHVLLAPLPDGVPIRHAPVLTPELQSLPSSAAVAGWTQLTIELSAGLAGLRIVLVLLDASGAPISASDAVVYRIGPAPSGAIGADDAHAGATAYLHESLGGRLESDGRFRGTRWRGVSREAADSAPGDGPVDLTPTEPSADEIAGLRTLVADVLRRWKAARA